MQSYSRTNYADVDGKWIEHRTTGDIVTSLGNQRINHYALNVQVQKLGIPNAPVVNAFKWNSLYYSFFRGSNKYYDTNWKLRYEAVDHTCIDGLPANGQAYAIDWSDMEGPAYSRFLGKVRDERANLAVDIAEGRQTYKMVASAMDTIVGYAKKIPVGPVSVMANAWLAYKYGWLPAFQTIYGVANFTKTNLLQRQITSSYVKQTNHGGLSHVNQGRTIVTPSGYTTQKIRYGARLVLRNPGMYDVQRLTSLNPAVIAWELVPFSFVFDWFYDVGGFLADSETVLSMGHNLHYGYKTYSRRTELLHEWESTTFGYQMPPTGNSQAYRVISARAGSRFKSYDRQPISSFSLPYAPTVQADLGASRIISGAALLHQLFHARKR